MCVCAADMPHYNKYIYRDIHYWPWFIRLHQAIYIYLSSCTVTETHWKWLEPWEPHYLTRTWYLLRQAKVNGSLRLWSYVASLSDSNGRRQGVERGSLDDSTWREQDFREMKVGRVLQSGAWAGLLRQLIVKIIAIKTDFIQYKVYVFDCYCNG
jgi:hypothetical protein